MVVPDEILCIVKEIFQVPFIPFWAVTFLLDPILCDRLAFSILNLLFIDYLVDFE